ncbi:MAG TPA: hypothetical protein VKV04_03735 [Verrucomicrobiae bacterium]|nr:hypothetical protein [Verrucomicrobiae bacterium]
MSKADYIARLQTTIQHLHNCGAVHSGSTPVHEIFRGQTVWNGMVEIFDLHNHPKAKRAYAWSHPEGPKDQGERIVTVLEIPPVKDAKTAVQASIMSDIQKSKRR